MVKIGVKVIACYPGNLREKGRARIIIPPRLDRDITRGPSQPFTIPSAVKTEPACRG